MYGTDPTTETFEETRKKVARKVVMRYSRGSVGLQFGRYMTREDLDRLSKEGDEALERINAKFEGRDGLWHKLKSFMKRIVDV